ncbi:MAG TPA: multicopper oxidase domain-containing protein [Pyrinomonadaceae bacterium]|jgi:FtsP/CotA-like multicopper oxidase with cupredoxin domain|nr:multicopper oxidase domain-containing protein [Pyrinomonadaceae bacterium]
MPKKKAKDRQRVAKKTEGTISRRTVLKIGAAAGAATVVAPNLLTSGTALGFQETIAEPVLCVTPPTSPPHHPFVQEFAAPFPADDHPLSPQPTEFPNLGAGEADRAPHPRWTQFSPAHFTYDMSAQAGLHTFHPDFSPTYIWGFNGRFPAPTLFGKYGKSGIVRFRNNLPVTTTTFGRNEITVHLHNGHHGSESDGFAGDFFGTGFWKDNLYPNCYAGLDAFGGNGDPREKMGSFWFHDHRAEFTLNNNVLGLNGMYIVYDETDPGHEAPAANSLQLPGYYGVTDFPLELVDHRFCPTANGRTELVNAAGGDKFIVNGMIQPSMTVRRRKYRFRILNTGPTQTYDLTLIKPDGSVGTITVIATDANFLEHPIPIDAGANAGNSNSTTAPIVPGGLRVSVAERYDIIIDFAQFKSGDKLYLKENRTMFVGNPSPDPLPSGLNIGNVLMQFKVVNTEPWFPADTPPIPATLCTYPPLPATDNTWEWQFVLVGGRFRVKRPFDTVGCTFDPDHSAHCMLQGTTEEWLLNNNIASGWTHPVHIHFEEFRTLKRFVNGVEVPVPPLMSGRKDVSRLEAGQGALIKMQFRDYSGRYLIHCHNMAHEDNFMMVRWDIVPDQASLDACIANQQICELEMKAKELFREEVA